MQSACHLLRRANSRSRLLTLAFCAPFRFAPPLQTGVHLRPACCPLWTRPTRAVRVTRATYSPPPPPPPPPTDADKLDDAPSNESGPRSVKELPPLDENDLEETFTKGQGPGGQKINKTSSTVVLKHKPSGIIVRCQEHRSQHRNRAAARVLLQRKLDEIERGKMSLAAQELSKARARKARRRRKAVKKHFKSRADRGMLDI